MKILITGSAGFIGYHLAKKLLNGNYEVMGIDNLNDYYDPILKKDRLSLLKSFQKFKFEKVDISDNESFLKVFKKFDPEKVINLAAQAGVRYSLTNPQAYSYSNLQGFINVLEACRQFNTRGLIYASSSSVYGSNASKPFKESDRTDKPISLYGATKKANELIAYSYSHLYGLNTTGLRYFTVYGSWYRPDMAMHIFSKKIYDNSPIEVYNNGNMKRDFTYIDDIIEGTLSALNNNFPCEVFNLGNNKSENLMDVIALLEKEYSKKATIHYKPLQPGDVLETYAAIDYSNKKLKYKPTTDIQIGIKGFTNWFKDYYNV